MSAEVASAAAELHDRFGADAQTEALRLSYASRLAGRAADAEHWLAVSSVLARSNALKARHGL